MIILGSNPSHPFNSFTIGNSDTIYNNRTVDEVAKRLKEYHRFNLLQYTETMLQSKAQLGDLS